MSIVWVMKTTNSSRMNLTRSFACVLLFSTFFAACEHEKEDVDYSGTYCLNIQNLEMTIVHTSKSLTFSVQNDLLVNGTGTVSGNSLSLYANTSSSELFTGTLTFSGDRLSFSGPFQITEPGGNITLEGILLGKKGSCAKYDISLQEIPAFIEKEFTQLDKIERVSRFRSAVGHSFTDGTESCRSMKHYFSPYPEFRQNNTLEIYSPVKGTITSVSNDGHGASEGLYNKLIQITPDNQPAFIVEIFHCDLVSQSIQTGKKVEAGELLGYARLYYEELEEYATSFDIAIWVNTKDGMQLLSYFEVVNDNVFNPYHLRGAASRQEFIITREERDTHLLQCDGDSFLTYGNLQDWVILSP